MESRMTSAGDAWPGDRGWRDFFDLLGDAVIVFDRRPCVVLANTAALRLLPCEVGMPLQQLQGVLGAGAVSWLERAASGAPRPNLAPAIALADGRSAVMRWRRLDPAHWAVHVTADSAAPPIAPDLGLTSPTAPLLDRASLREMIATFWESPFPATLQDTSYRFVDVNPAFVEFTGYPRDHLIGRDPLELMPPEDEEINRARRARITATAGRALVRELAEGRLIDAGGRERPYRVARRILTADDGSRVLLAVLQDVTAEHVARERADHSLRELDDWFDLSPVGMVLFDASGLLVRTNPAFDALAGVAPVSLADAPLELQQLLAWGEGEAAPQPGGPAVWRQGAVTPFGAPTRLLRSVVRCHETVPGQRRYMAIVEDRSVEEERDLAQVQIGALIDTAGVGIATFQESSGWVRQRSAGTGGSGEPGAAAAALQSIGRDVVAPESMPEFERLQAALRLGQRAEVRYAIRHHELGERWLLTRVEPATLASGKRTTSVVTLDVTEQQLAQQRSEQLLHELATILESSTAGIAYLRGDVLVRCNRRFETMLGLEAGSVVGSGLQRLFGAFTHSGPLAREIDEALAGGGIFETEFELAGSAAGDAGSALARWYSLSVRRSAHAPDAHEAIAVLSDVTRLKLQQLELETLARDRELMFNLSGVGIAFVRNATIQRANQALARLVGHSVAELSVMPLAALFASAAEFEQRWAEVDTNLRLYGVWTGERQLRTSDGRLLWVQASKRLVTPGDLSGGVIASYVNVDARRRAERSVALQAERTRSILDSVLVGIVTVGPNGIEWMNRSARRMFGGDVADFVNLPIATVATADPDHPLRRDDPLGELVEGEAATFECRIKARDGREFWVVGNVVATGREASGPQLTYALLDIERRRQAEARMSEAQDSLQRVIEAAPLAISLRDARTLKLLQLNEVAARLVGKPRAALIGRTPEQMYAPATAAVRRADMEQALVSAAVTTREYRIVVNGETQVWDARYLPLAGGPGEPPDQLLMVSSDVTEQRAAQEARLEAAIAQREMLVREVHHRIKNNLQGVAGLLQQIAQRKPEVAGPIAEIVGQVQAIAQVHGMQVGSSGLLNLAEVIEAITASVQRTFGRTIRFGVLDEAVRQWMLPEGESIPIALTINELLTNAVKHGAAGSDGSVGCALELLGNGVRLRVTNRATLPAGFSLQGIPGGVSGLGLVRALLPRRHATLAIEQTGADVTTTFELESPVVVRAAVA
jgi:PAS domain S-box-containing protein